MFDRVLLFLMCNRMTDCWAWFGIRWVVVGKDLILQLRSITLGSKWHHQQQMAALQSGIFCLHFFAEWEEAGMCQNLHGATNIKASAPKPRFSFLLKLNGNVLKCVFAVSFLYKSTGSVSVLRKRSSLDTVHVRNSLPGWHHGPLLHSHRSQYKIFELWEARYTCLNWCGFFSRSLLLWEQASPYSCYHIPVLTSSYDPAVQPL